MGLFTSDTLLIDPMLDAAFRLQDTLVDYVCATDLERDEYEHEVADPTSWPSLAIWPRRQMASV